MTNGSDVGGGGGDNDEGDINGQSRLNTFNFCVYSRPTTKVRFLKGLLGWLRVFEFWVSNVIFKTKCV